MSVNLNDTVRAARMTVVKDAIDAAVGAATLKIYNGPRPAAGGSATTLLLSYTLSATCGTQDGATLNFTLPSPAQVAESGTAAWARVADGDGNWVIDGDCGTTGSGYLVELEDLALTAGDWISISAAALTEA